jgi:hypothetical protein
MKNSSLETIRLYTIHYTKDSSFQKTQRTVVAREKKKELPSFDGVYDPAHSRSECVVLVVFYYFQ